MVLLLSVSIMQIKLGVLNMERVSSDNLSINTQSINIKKILSELNSSIFFSSVEISQISTKPSLFLVIISRNLL